ncbi:MAG: hypothetical protein Q9180_007918 [Flavoplaca navasiana]
MVHPYPTRFSLVDRTRVKQEDSLKTNDDTAMTGSSALATRAARGMAGEIGEDTDEEAFGQDAVDDTDDDEYIDQGDDDEEDLSDDGDKDKELLEDGDSNDESLEDNADAMMR